MIVPLLTRRIPRYSTIQGCTWKYNTIQYSNSTYSTVLHSSSQFCTFRESPIKNSNLCNKNVSRPNFRRYSSRNVIATLAARGMLQEVWPMGDVSTHQLVAFLEKEDCGLYAGFDPTAPSLHVGNLLILVGLLQFHRAGHRVVVLLGGATARIGDPSGKNKERQEMAEEELQENLVGIEKNIRTIFTNHEKYFWRQNGGKSLLPVEVVNNDSWYKDMNIVEFLSTVGRRLRISWMLNRTSVKSRLETAEGLSLTEFTYQAFQGYDWLHLFRTRGCRLQLGGSDQLGNIVAGMEMLSSETKAQCWGITLPLVTDTQGNKFGKTAGSPVWLDREKTSPFDFYQFFVRVPDSSVESMLHYFTFLPEQEVNNLMEKHKKKPENREAQVTLARNLTLLVHGQEGLDMAEKTTAVLYSQDLQTLARLTTEEARQVFVGGAYLRKLFQPGLTVLDFASQIGCFRNEKDAIRIIGAGGFYINTVKVTGIEEVLTHGKHVMENGLTVVRVGKKNYYIVEWT